MIINHPLLGPRDAAEFTYLGDASLIDRPDGMTDDALQAFIEYAYLRNNVAGNLQENLQKSRCSTPLGGLAR